MNKMKKKFLRQFSRVCAEENAKSNLTKYGRNKSVHSWREE